MVLVDYVNVDDIFGYLSSGKGRGREVRSLPLGFCVPIPLFQKSDTPSWGGEGRGENSYIASIYKLHLQLGRGRLSPIYLQLPLGWVGG